MFSQSSVAATVAATHYEANRSPPALNSAYPDQAAQCKTMLIVTYILASVLTPLMVGEMEAVVLGVILASAYWLVWGMFYGIVRHGSASGYSLIKAWTVVFWAMYACGFGYLYWRYTNG